MIPSSSPRRLLFLVCFALVLMSSEILPATELAKLLALDGHFGDQLGSSVAISGETAILGAPRAELQGGLEVGAAYIFVRDGAGWSQQAKLQLPDWEADDLFGYSVAISGETAVVGSYYGCHEQLNCGTVYVYVRNGSSWSEQARLYSPDQAINERFASAVALSGDTLVVGASLASTPTRFLTGAAYVYVRTGSHWSLQAKLSASDGYEGGSFGWSVAISGETAVIGAPGFSPNAAYIFTRRGSRWYQQARLSIPGEDDFGYSVAISGDTVAVGAPQPPYRQVGTTHVYVNRGSHWTLQAGLSASDQATNGLLFGWSVALSGDTIVVGTMADERWEIEAAYVFVRRGSTWSEQDKLVASDGVPWDRFGQSVAVSGGSVLVGARDGDGREDGTGAAYAFAVPGVTVTPTAGLLTLERGGTATSALALNTPPAGDVVIDLVSSDSGEATVSPAQITFTAEDWSTPQTFTLTGVDDGTTDDGQPYAVALSMNQEWTEDPLYRAIDPADVSAVNLGFDGDFYLLPACRMLDTRQAPQEPLASGVDRVLAVHDACGVPPTVRAVAVAVTAVLPTGNGFLTLHPGDFPHPGFDTLLFTAGWTRTTHAIVLLASDGTGTLTVAPFVEGDGSAHLVLDLAGYFE